MAAVSVGSHGGVCDFFREPKADQVEIKSADLTGFENAKLIIDRKLV